MNPPQGVRSLGKDVGSPREACLHAYMAVGQNQWYHFGVGAPPILVYF